MRALQEAALNQGNFSVVIGYLWSIIDTLNKRAMSEFSNKMIVELCSGSFFSTTSNIMLMRSKRNIRLPAIIMSEMKALVEAIFMLKIFV